MFWKRVWTLYRTADAQTKKFGIYGSFINRLHDEGLKTRRYVYLAQNIQLTERYTGLTTRVINYPDSSQIRKLEYRIFNILWYTSYPQDGGIRFEEKCRNDTLSKYYKLYRPFLTLRMYVVYWGGIVWHLLSRF